MSSDPKGPEPTPLTAEELVDVRMQQGIAAKTWPRRPEDALLPDTVMRLFATIDAQATQIEGYRQALAEYEDKALVFLSVVQHPSLRASAETVVLLGQLIDGFQEAIAKGRVLAGKEAQGGG